LDCILYEVQTQAEGAVDNINLIADTDCILLEIKSEAAEIFENLYYISSAAPFLPYPRKVATTDSTVQTHLTTPKTWETKHRHP
jgi:hypothetical protein